MKDPKPIYFEILGRELPVRPQMIEATLGYYPGKAPESINLMIRDLVYKTKTLCSFKGVSILYADCGVISHLSTLRIN